MLQYNVIRKHFYFKNNEKKINQKQLFYWEKREYLNQNIMDKQSNQHFLLCEAYYLQGVH